MTSTKLSSCKRLMPCPHCDCLLSKKTFEAHKRLYYDGSTDQWIKKCCLEASEDLDFEEPIDFHSSSDTKFPDIVADAPPVVDFGDVTDTNEQPDLPEGKPTLAV